jgi:hypothetical protein
MRRVMLYNRFGDQKFAVDLGTKKPNLSILVFSPFAIAIEILYQVIIPVDGNCVEAIAILLRLASFMRPYPPIYRGPLIVFHRRPLVGGLHVVPPHPFSAEGTLKKRLEELLPSVVDRSGRVSVVLPVRRQAISDKPHSFMEWRILALIQQGFGLRVGTGSTKMSAADLWPTVTSFRTAFCTQFYRNTLWLTTVNDEQPPYLLALSSGPTGQFPVARPA